jgi:hypothetical protein
MPMLFSCLRVYQTPLPLLGFPAPAARGSIIPPP